MERAGRAWRRGGDASAHLRPDAGLTLLELVVAVSVFAVVAGGLASVVGSGFNLARNNRNRSIAANLASQEMDRVRGMPFANLLLQYGTTTTTQTVQGVSYTVSRSVVWESVNATTTVCASQVGKSGAQVLGVSVRVSWPAMRGVPPATATTEISPPVGVTQSSSDGAIPVTVYDHTGVGAQNDLVTVSSASTSVQLPTDVHGCAYFVLPAGSYTVSLGTSGYVDRTGNASPSQSFTLPAGGSVPVQFDYDLAGAVSLTLSAANGGSVPPVPVALGYQYFPPNGVRTFGGSGSPRTIASLFPGGYQAWAGDCVDADPEGQDPSTGSRYWPAAQRPAPISVPATATVPGTVTLATVNVSVTKAGVPASGATVTAVHDDATAPGACPTTGEQYALGTTDASGSLAAGLPFGHWVVHASDGVASGSQGVAVDPSQASPSFPVAVVIG